MDTRLYRHLPRCRSTQPSALAIGNFDGVHLGHQAILQRVRATAQTLDLLPSVMMFTPHPRTYFARIQQQPDRIPAQITGLRDKVLALHDLGMQQIILLRFKQQLAEMSPERFIADLLVQGLNTRCLFIGQDFRFGAKRAGDVTTLQRAATRFGFSVKILDDVTDAQAQRISSSEIRAALAAGDLTRVEALLGRPYAISGHVIHGQKLGRTLGFPTLNLAVPAPCAARAGIYVVRVHGLASKPLPGVASLGVRPTVAAHGEVLLETHLLDQNINAYGALIRVEFLTYLRDEATFSDLHALKAAIAQDVQRARDEFAHHGLSQNP